MDRHTETGAFRTRGQQIHKEAVRILSQGAISGMMGCAEGHDWQISSVLSTWGGSGLQDDL